MVTQKWKPEFATKPTQKNLLAAKEYCDLLPMVSYLYKQCYHDWEELNHNFGFGLDEEPARWACSKCGETSKHSQRPASLSYSIMLGEDTFKLLVDGHIDKYIEWLTRLCIGVSMQQPDLPALEAILFAGETNRLKAALLTFVTTHTIP
jgi:hypothetical protein